MEKKKKYKNKKLKTKKTRCVNGLRNNEEDRNESKGKYKQWNQGKRKKGD